MNECPICGRPTVECPNCENVTYCSYDEECKVCGLKADAYEKATLEYRKQSPEAVENALKVLVLCPEIRAWLLAHDPKALAQAESALGIKSGRAK